MPNTYVKIASVTVGSGGAANIDFTSIPSTYTDLKLVHSTRMSGANPYEVIALEFNNDTTTANYNFMYLYANGNATSSGSGNIKFGGYGNAASATASTFGNTEIYVPNYLGSNQKSYSTDTVVENNSTTNGQWILAIHAGKWSNTSAITSVKLIPGSGTFVQYSTATLYGIKNS
jgi:hypothetical protein